MSRCFPYPPPGYVKSEIRDDAVIESIKLQREADQKQRKKEKKREKKEKEKENGDVQSKKHKHKRRHKEERSQEDQIGGGYEKRRENEVDCLEKSSLTEEQGHPVGSQNSTDSTFNSNKRQKLTSPPEGRHKSGSIIRIKLPTPRQKDPVVLPSKEQLCSPLERIDDTSVRGMRGPAPLPAKEPCSTSGNVGPELTIRLSKDKPSSSAVVAEIPALKDEADLPLNLCGSCSPGFASQYRDLIEKWVPPPLQLEDTELDQSWLFETKKDPNRKANRREVDSVGSAGVNSTSAGLARENSTNVVLVDNGSSPYPHARYLPEAGIYALPYVLPF